MTFNTTIAQDSITVEQRVQEVITAVTDAGHLDQLTDRSIGFKYLLGGLGITSRATADERKFVNSILDTLGIE